MKKIMILKSVGCALNTRSGMVSPITSNGKFDYYSQRALGEHSEEWDSALDLIDREAIAEYQAHCILRAQRIQEENDVLDEEQAEHEAEEETEEGV